MDSSVVHDARACLQTRTSWCIIAVHEQRILDQWTVEKSDCARGGQAQDDKSDQSVVYFDAAGGVCSAGHAHGCLHGNVRAYAHARAYDDTHAYGDGESIGCGDRPDRVGPRRIHHAG